MILYFQGDGTVPSAVNARAVAARHQLVMAVSFWTGEQCSTECSLFVSKS